MVANFSPIVGTSSFYCAGASTEFSICFSATFLKIGSSSVSGKVLAKTPTFSRAFVLLGEFSLDEFVPAAISLPLFWSEILI